MCGIIIGLRLIFLDLEFWLRWPSHKNRITFQAIKWEGLIFTKNISGKKFLECYKDQNEWQHHRATTNISRPWFLAEKAESQKRKYVSGHKMITTHFHEKNVSVKMFLVCYEDQNECQHHRAPTNISQTWFLTEKAKSQKRKYFSGRKMRKTHFHEKCFR